MITELLPTYYGAVRADATYTVVRSMVIEGHEVAWMKYEGRTAADITGQGRENKPFVGYDLYCECYFTEGVGWRREKDGCAYGIIRTRKCPYFETAQKMRLAELQQEYIARFKKSDKGIFTADEFEKIVLDLMEKVKAGEFIGEGGGGATLWGGYFYLQTAQEIMCAPMAVVYNYANKLVQQNKISLEGAVVQSYRKPPRPAYVESGKLLMNNGWRGIMYLPAHSKMKQDWKLEIFGPDGKKRRRAFLSLTYTPTFGPDVDDVYKARKKLWWMMVGERFLERKRRQK